MKTGRSRGCPKFEFSQEQLNEIHDLYESGLGIPSLMKKYNLSQSVFDRIFKENHWSKRKRSDYKKYTINEEYFDNIDTPNKAYIIGLLAADGCNYVDRGEIRLSLQERDKSILYDINDEIQSNHPISIRHFSNPNWQDSYTLTINNLHISQQLNNLGIIKNKSLNLDFPQWITPELFPFYLKGYIDGDGWIQKYILGFMSSDKFCYGVCDYLLSNYKLDSKVMDMKRHYSQQTKTWYMCGKRNQQYLVEMMFSQPVLGIERKNQKYYEFNYLDINNSLSA